MEKMRTYELPKLEYGYDALAPYISEEQLRLHHDKHHLAYVNGANAALEKLAKARRESADVDMKAILKELSFHLGGHELHSIFWWNMAPAGKGGGGQPQNELKEYIDKDFGGFERFRKEFSQAAISAEGSGWAALTYLPHLDSLCILQIEKHNCNFPPVHAVLMDLDVWEHAYYLDYKNDRAKFVEAFWNIVNWGHIAERFARLREFYRQPALSR